VADIHHQARRIAQFDDPIGVGRVDAGHPLEVGLEITGDDEFEEGGEGDVASPVPDGGPTSVVVRTGRRGVDPEPAVTRDGDGLTGAALANGPVDVLGMPCGKAVAGKLQDDPVEAVMACGAE